ncbi:cupin domain-containing protein [Burkholderia diffusa]|uniref:cupin domain-containing protein n=1 Tax=Burkholderia diffusa TaxID=488732 RepID=UPI002AB176C4|nr:cupin domain-containing protein [Burkholderia diffusa]
MQDRTKCEHAGPLVGLKIKGERRWYSINESDWKPMKIGVADIPGFFWIPVATDENGAWASYWMRVDAGAQSPKHRHDSTELILILDGTFTDDDGTDFLPGQTVSYLAGSQHSTSSAHGCTVLVVSQTGASITKSIVKDAGNVSGGRNLD